MDFYRIADATDPGDYLTETLTLDPVAVRDYPMAQTVLSFLKLCRLEDDRVEIRYPSAERGRGHDPGPRAPPGGAGMTYDDREKSRYAGPAGGGVPVRPGQPNLWLFTSADRAITLPAGVFTPGGHHPERARLLPGGHRRDDRVHAPAHEPGGGALHRATSRPRRSGSRSTAPTGGTRTSRSRSSAARSSGPGSRSPRPSSPARASWPCWPARCRSWPCRPPATTSSTPPPAGPTPRLSRDQVTVTSVDGATVVSNDFALRPDQWFRGRAARDRRRRDPVHRRPPGRHGHADLAAPGPDVARRRLGLLGLRPPRGHLPGQVRQPVNHLGWSRLPGRNPFVGRID